MKTLLRVCQVLALVFLAAPSVVTSAATPSDKAAVTAGDVSGTWDVVVETSEGSGTPVLVLQQDGAKVSGKYQGQLGDAPISGSIQGKNIRLTFKTGAGEGVQVEYTGVVEGDAMSGKAKMGADGEGTFSAKRRSGK